MASVTANSRMIYAFSRDGALPGSRRWHRINPRTRTPTNSVWLGVTLAFLLGFLTFLQSGSYAVAFFAFVGITAVGLYIAYVIPVFLRLRSKTFVKGPWHLRGFSKIVGWTAVVYVIFINLMFFAPQFGPVSAMWPPWGGDVPGTTFPRVNNFNFTGPLVIALRDLRVDLLGGLGQEVVPGPAGHGRRGDAAPDRGRAGRGRAGRGPARGVLRHGGRARAGARRRPRGRRDAPRRPRRRPGRTGRGYRSRRCERRSGRWRRERQLVAGTVAGQPRGAAPAGAAPLCLDACLDAVTDELTPLLDRVPGWRGRARVLGALEGGITNRNFLVDVDGERFVLRLAGKDTHLLGIDREVERAANEQAAGLGIAPPVARLPRTRGLPRHPLRRGRSDPDRGDARAGRTSGASPRRSARSTAPPRSPACSTASGSPRPTPAPRRSGACACRPSTTAPIEVAHRIERAFTADPEPPVPCHNDLLNANFLLDATANDGQGRMWLLDWEYAGMNDRWFDLGNFATNNELDGEAEHGLLTAYFGASTDRRRARLALMKVDERPARGDVGRRAAGRQHARLRLRRLRGPALRPAAAQRRRARVRPSCSTPRPGPRSRGAGPCVTGPRSSSSAPGSEGRASRGTSPSAAGPTCSCSSGPRPTSGSTFHSAGLVGQLRSSPAADPDDDAQRRRVPAARGRGAGDGPLAGVARGRVAAHRVDARAPMEELTRQHGWAKTFGLPMELLSAAEAHERFPLMDPAGVLGAVWLPTDGHLDPSGLTYAFLGGAKARGVTVETGVRVTGSRRARRAHPRRRHRPRDRRGRDRRARVRHVHDRGRRARRRQRADRPDGAPVRDHRSRSRASPTIAAAAARPRQPRVLPPRVGRSRRSAGYERDPAPWSLHGVPADFNNKLLPEDWDRFAPLIEQAIRRVPAVEHVEIVQLVNGPEGFTPDNEFVLGESEVHGLFVAAGFCAHGIAGAGGVGRVDGRVDRSTASRASTPGRWTSAASAPQYRSPRATRWRAPSRCTRPTTTSTTRTRSGRPGGRCAAPRRTSGSPRSAARSARRAVWERPNWFEPNAARGDADAAAARLGGRALEPGHRRRGARLPRHRGAVRRDELLEARARAAAGAAAFLDRVCANEMDQPVGSVIYTQLCNERGGIECDLTATRARARPRTSSSPAPRSATTTSAGCASSRSGSPRATPSAVHDVDRRPTRASESGVPGRATCSLRSPRPTSATTRSRI